MLINKQVGVLGAGQMGAGIAIVMNRNAGLKVKIVDKSEKQLSESRKYTENLFDKEIQKSRLTNDEKYQILERFTYTLKIDDLNESDFIIEVIILILYTNCQQDLSMKNISIISTTGLFNNFPQMNLTF